ncbi:MAG: homoserine dehydrogenase [Corynebacteriales bacterium]|nr:homoserine dehydrogenase [Mycobacteriales bacterium]
MALLGYGTVGRAVYELLTHQADELTERIGAPLEVVGVAVHRADVPRPELRPELITTDANSLVSRPDVDIVVELVGGVEPTRTWLTTALKSGKSVVTANKALLAAEGAALHDAAHAGNADLYFEAAVAGAIPVLRPLRESLLGDQVFRVLGIVNGTTNYILSKMDETGASFKECLAEATELGYAEADPTADVEGYDAAAKTAILGSLAFHSRVSLDQVHREGISNITAEDFAAARRLGRTIKLLSIAERTDKGIGVRVHPAMIPRTHPLASVNGAFNAIYVEARAAGQLMFYGPGAGGNPTASAVLGDLVAVARNRRNGGRAAGESTYAALRVHPMGETTTRYYIKLEVIDKPGVLAKVATAHADNNVSIATLEQEGLGADAMLNVVTHAATDAQLNATVSALRGLDAVRDVLSVMRVEI